MSEERPTVVGATMVHQGRFISFKTLDWMDTHGTARKWESIERAAPGAVLIIARLRPSDRILLIRQYRPPARRYVYEFPAGLTDEGETPAVAAARELREETGYSAKSLRIFPPAYTTPGMADEAVNMVLADIDETAPENANPKTDFDPSENIETILVPHAELGALYHRETEKGHAFDAKLAAYILATDTFK